MAMSSTPSVEGRVSTSSESLTAVTDISDNDEFEVKALSVGGQLLGAEQIDVLAKLPTREQALASLMSVMQAPVVKLVRTANEVPGKLVRVMAAVRDQKQEAA